MLTPPDPPALPPAESAALERSASEAVTLEPPSPEPGSTWARPYPPPATTTAAAATASRGCRRRPVRTERACSSGTTVLPAPDPSVEDGRSVEGGGSGEDGCCEDPGSGSAAASWRSVVPMRSTTSSGTG